MTKYLRNTITITIFMAAMVSSPARADTWFDKGLDAYADGLYGEAARLWTRSAESGDSRARFNLAVLFEHGQGVTQNIETAASWYRLAAKGGFADAQYSLANLLVDGAGPVAQNTNEALMWYMHAAEAGHIPSQYKLGSLLYDGDTIDQDLASAERWLQLASTNGHVEADALLARIRNERDRNIRNAGWVAERDPAAWTVELFRSPDETRARKFVRLAGLESAAVLQLRDGIHYVVSGVFVDAESAQSAARELPDSLRQWIPAVRQFDELQRNMDF